MRPDVHKWRVARRDILSLEPGPLYSKSKLGVPVINELRCSKCGVRVNVLTEGRGWGRGSKAAAIRHSNIRSCLEERDARDARDHKVVRSVMAS